MYCILAHSAVSALVFILFLGRVEQKSNQLLSPIGILVTLQMFPVVFKAFSGLTNPLVYAPTSVTVNARQVHEFLTFSNIVLYIMEA